MIAILDFNYTDKSKPFYYPSLSQTDLSLRAMCRDGEGDVLRSGKAVVISTGLYLVNSNQPLYLTPLSLDVGLVLETPMLQIRPDRRKEITVTLRNIRPLDEPPILIVHGEAIARLISLNPIGAISVSPYDANDV